MESPMRLHSVVFAMLLLAAPAHLLAQRARERPPLGRLSIEPYVGVIRDGYDFGNDDSKLGLLTGARLGVAVGSRLRVVVDAALAKSQDVARSPGTSYFVYRNDYRIATIGIEGDVVTGRTGVVGGLAVGSAWRRVVRTGQVGTPADDGLGSDEWSPNEVLVPSLGIRRQVTARVAVAATGHIQYAHFLEGARTSPILTLGLVYR
jgi:hypothetical protein